MEEAVNSISWAHQLAGYSAMSESGFVRIVLDGLQCELAKSKLREEPVTMMPALVDSQGTAPSLSDM